MNINLVFYNTFSGREDFEMPCGTRKWHSFLILKEGSISFIMNGREDTAGAGDAVFFPADLFMRRRVLEPISFHQMAFFAAPDHPYASALRAGRLEVPRGHILSAVETLDRLQYGTIREREQLYCGVLDNLILENYVYSGGMPVADRSTDPTVYEALRYINDHLAEKIRVPDIAAHVHLSNVGLIWKFRNVLGRTPTEMILVMRMQYAKYLILESRKPLKEIAQLCGYSSPFYFSNTFHKYYGCQPSRCAKLMDGFGKTREGP